MIAGERTKLMVAQFKLSHSRVFGLGRGIGLRHQHIAVGQHMQPTRVVQAAGERSHARSPVPVEIGSLATSVQAASAKTTTPTNGALERGRTHLTAERKRPVKAVP